MNRWKFTLRDRVTGEARAYELDMHGHDGALTDDQVQFFFTDGNGGCDCNRSLWYARAKGEAPLSPPLLCTLGENQIVLSDLERVK